MSGPPAHPHATPRPLPPPHTPCHPATPTKPSRSDPARQRPATRHFPKPTRPSYPVSTHSPQPWRLLIAPPKAPEKQSDTPLSGHRSGSFKKSRKNAIGNHTGVNNQIRLPLRPEWVSMLLVGFSHPTRLPGHRGRRQTTRQRRPPQALVGSVAPQAGHGEADGGDHEDTQDATHQ